MAQKQIAPTTMMMSTPISTEIMLGSPFKIFPLPPSASFAQGQG
jgi:hypothetical protein